MRSLPRLPFAACAAALALLAAPSFAAKPPDPAWSEVEKLASEQKFEAAAEKVRAMRAAAKASGDSAEYTRALIKEVQLRTALHGYETAVRLLREEPWPQDQLSRTVLDLYYARQLVTYLHMYGWEIGQRERVDSKGVDLKAWTRDQIYAEAQKAYLEIWAQRDSLGKQQTAKFSEYIDPNNYPAGIRSTLRDAASYLFAQLLADSSLWRPDHSNEVFELDLKTLLRGAPKVDLADPAAHPMVKLAAVLGDLESWHQREQRPQAALEASLERMRHLHQAFTQPDDRAAIRAGLQERLKGTEKLPWWSMGMSQLAQFTREEDAPDNLIRARDIALEGAKRFPNEPGGVQCRSIATSIEQPAFHVESMATDGPGRRSIRVTHRNLATLWMRAYPLDLDESLKRGLGLNHDLLRRLLASGKAVHTWKVELPATVDFKDHHTFVTPPMARQGAWIVVASAREDFALERNSLPALPFVVTDLVLVSRQSPGELEVTAHSGASGAALEGVEVTLYRQDWNRGPYALGTTRTDAKGLARFKVERGASVFLAARKGPDRTIDFDEMYGPYDQERREERGTLLYTDRTVYRPQQKLMFKAVAYKGRADQGRFQTLPKTKLKIDLLDANGQAVESRDLTTNAFGSAAGEFTIPAGRLLGAWSLRSSLEGYASVRVEEYKRPTFEVALKDAAGALRLNREATLSGEARYYFGLPVTGATARWKVVRTPVWPWWWGWWGRSGAVREQIVGSGAVPLSRDGTFQFKFTPAADEREASQGVTYRYQVSADVTDEGGETRSASRSFRLGLVAVESTITSDVGFFTEGAPVHLSLTRTDLNGAPRAGRGTWRLFSLAQPESALLPADQPRAPAPEKLAKYQTPGDRLRARFAPEYTPQAVLALWKDGAARGEGQLEHGATGAATLELPSLPPGAYRLRYETRDEFGAKAEAFHEFVVAGAKTPLALPALLLPERASVPAGEKARFLVHSGLADQLLVFEVYQDGRRLERRPLVSGGASIVELAIQDKHRGGLSVVLTAVRDHQLMTLQQPLLVPWDDKELKVELSTFRDQLRPGSRETWRATVKAVRGGLQAEATELLAYMYDRSLDLFAPHSPPDVLGLYPNTATGAAVSSTLMQMNARLHEGTGLAEAAGWTNLTSDRLLFHDPYGVGGPGVRRYRRKAMHFEAETFDGDLTRAAPPAPAPEGAPVQSGERRAELKSQNVEIVRNKLAAGGEPAPAAEMRSNFAETAFFLPQLIVGQDGSTAIEFSVPDSVTSWNVWLHALTRDLRGGSLKKEARTVKDLMVRPYLPRFLREGDKATIKVVVNNAAERALDGKVTLDIVDPETNASVAKAFGLPGAATASFSAPKGGSANASFTLTAPRELRTVAFRVSATSGDFTDGELRPVPVLPGRVHLMQSRFASLQGKERRELRFEDLARGGDPTRIDEQLVVTVDAQLFYGVLSALPYLVNYPYECTEQTLNRFVSTGIVSSLYGQYPAVARMAKELSKRSTPLESFDAQDPNRKLTLEESPWLMESKGGKDAGLGMVNVLDPRAAAAEREASLNKLRKAQTASGGFPWWPGGPPSEYMTLYLLYGFAKASEFGVQVPQDMVERGWAYLAERYREDWAKRMMKDDVGWELLTFLNYIASTYRDPSWMGRTFGDQDRKAILDFSFKHWKQHSPYLKGMLALTLKRMGRAKDAELVFASVMDSAKTTRDEGTFWAPEDRAWLWYNDTIETHAFALRVLTELSPKDARRQGLVHWLMLNKKLNHWKSTKATAEVLYSLAGYLKAEGELGIREDLAVQIGPRRTDLVFEPDQYTGKKNQIVVPGAELDPKTMSTVVVEKQSKGLAFASASWHFSTEQLPKEARGDLFAVTRRYLKRETRGKEMVLTPLADGAKVSPGDEVEVQLSIKSRAAAEYVHLRDPRPAGFEPVSQVSRYKWELGVGLYEEVRDSASNFFFEWLPQGEYTFKYRLRAAHAGSFRASPATLQSMYAPEFGAYSAGDQLSVQ